MPSPVQPRGHRPRGRPRRLVLPDPAAYDFRRWVLEHPPEEIHREILVRLRARPDLLKLAMAWGLGRRWVSACVAASPDTRSPGGGWDPLPLTASMVRRLADSPWELLRPLKAVSPEEPGVSPFQQLRSDLDDEGRRLLDEAVDPLRGFTSLPRQVLGELLIREARRPLDIPLSFFACLTIDSPEIQGISGPFQLLPPWPAEEERRRREPPLALFTARDNVLGELFKTMLTLTAREPLPDERELLQEYTEVLKALQRRRGRGRRGRSVLDPGPDRSVRLQLGTHPYAIPAKDLARLGQRPKPSAVAVALLAHAHGTNDRYLRRRLRHARREQPLRAAWATYFAWLHAHEPAMETVKSLFEPFSVTLPKPEPSPA